MAELDARVVFGAMALSHVPGGIAQFWPAIQPLQGWMCACLGFLLIETDLDLALSHAGSLR